jgi:filamentous hemagglutinin
VQSVSGKLELKKADRSGYQQKIAGGADRKQGDQGGHLVARIFNGPGDGINMVPMSKKVNQKEYRAMEKTLSDAVNRGEKVEIEIRVRYPKGGTSARPSEIVVVPKYDGKQAAPYLFKN